MASNRLQATENALGHPVAPAPRQKRSVWTGVRFRQGGRWAAEIRVPRTKDRIWIGVFEKEREAALAYDAAIFCFFGKNPPPPRKFNFPDAPRPDDIPDDVRAQLTVADIKDIAKKHALAVAGLLPPPASTAAEPAVAVAPPDIYHGLNPNPVDVELNLGTAANGNLNAADDMVFISEEEFVAGDY